MKFDARRCAWLLMTVLAAAPSVRAQSLPEAGRTLLRKYERSAVSYTHLTLPTNREV